MTNSFDMNLIKIAVGVKHMEGGDSLITVDMTRLYEHMNVKEDGGLTIASFVEFVIDGYDKPPMDVRERRAEQYRTSLLIKTEDGRFYSTVGHELMTMRERVLGYLRENTDPSSELEFYQKEFKFVIKIVNPV